jgi:hypothetical protein
MKKVEAIIKPFKLDDVKAALHEMGVQGRSKTSNNVASVFGASQNQSTRRQPAGDLYFTFLGACRVRANSHQGENQGWISSRASTWPRRRAAPQHIRREYQSREEAARRWHATTRRGEYCRGFGADTVPLAAGFQERGLSGHFERLADANLTVPARTRCGAERVHHCDRGGSSTASALGVPALRLRFRGEAPAAAEIDDGVAAIMALDTPVNLMPITGMLNL